jgi:hypothetical protein
MLAGKDVAYDWMSTSEGLRKDINPVLLKL